MGARDILPILAYETRSFQTPENCPRIQNFEIPEIEARRAPLSMAAGVLGRCLNAFGDCGTATGYQLETNNNPSGDLVVL